MFKSIAILDTNVIYPILIRDLLFWFASYDLFEPKWSGHIFEEWEAVMLRKGVLETEATKRIKRADTAFPEARVIDYSHLIEPLQLPDPKDRHVLAAAISCKANFIVTANLKDFPPAYLQTFGVQAISPDDFLSGLIEEDSASALEAFKTMVAQKKNPPVHAGGVLAQMQKAGLVVTADRLLRSL